MFIASASEVFVSLSVLQKLFLVCCSIPQNLWVQSRAFALNCFRQIDPSSQYFHFIVALSRQGFQRFVNYFSRLNPLHISARSLLSRHLVHSLRWGRVHDGRTRARFVGVARFPIVGAFVRRWGAYGAPNTCDVYQCCSGNLRRAHGFSLSVSGV